MSDLNKLDKMKELALQENLTPGMVVAIIDQLESAQQRIAGLESNQELNLKIKQAMFERFTRAEAELACRDAAGGDPVYQVGTDGHWYDCKEYIYQEAKERRDACRILYTHAQPSAGEPAAYRYRFVKPAETDFEGNPWVGDWKYCNAEDSQSVNRSAGYEVQELFATPPAPSAPDGWAKLPAKLSADDGAKAALSGEFLEVKFISCPECFGDDDCDSCDGSGRVKVEIPVSWTTIKAIWEKGVQHFSAASAPEVD